MAQYFYVRVSTKEQKEDRQVVAAHEFGIEDRNIFKEKRTGKNFERPVYKRLLRKLQAGD